jgi:hypothetical protein
VALSAPVLLNGGCTVFLTTAQWRFQMQYLIWLNEKMDSTFRPAFFLKGIGTGFYKGRFTDI